MLLCLLLLRRYDRDDAVALVTHEWRRLAVIVDKILFWIFLVGTLASTIVILVLIPLTRWI
jgi:nicotinic acetylcholine receptor, invertebrate